MYLPELGCTLNHTGGISLQVNTSVNSALTAPQRRSSWRFICGHVEGHLLTDLKTRFAGGDSLLLSLFVIYAAASMLSVMRSGVRCRKQSGVLGSSCTGGACSGWSRLQWAPPETNPQGVAGLT